MCRRDAWSGFYDPCPGDEKQLRIRYLFKDKMHHVTINDNDELVIPLKGTPCSRSFLFGSQEASSLTSLSFPPPHFIRAPGQGDLQRELKGESRHTINKAQHTLEHSDPHS